MLSLYKVKCKFECYADKALSREEYRYVFAKTKDDAEKFITEIEGFDEEDGEYYVDSCEFLREATKQELKDGVSEGVGGGDWNV